MTKDKPRGQISEKELKRKILEAYSSDAIWKHPEYLTKLSRMAGTEDELKAAKYIKGKLDEYGVESEIYECDAYISHPGKSELEIISPVKKSLPCLPRTYTASTSPDGIQAELIAVGNGLEEDYKGLDAKGKIVLLKPSSIEGRLQAWRTGENRGASAQIHITGGQKRVVAMGQVRSIWGNPTPETKDNIPAIPGISISEEDGDYLIELSQKAKVMVSLKVDAWRGYKKIRIPVGNIRGNKEADKYVLVGAHYCCWFTGATDNAVSNSLMLEMARIFSKYRKRFNRGIKFAWWSGHEQGSYAGSTWFADTFWDDIRENAIAYLVMDGLRGTGVSGFAPRNTEEIRSFHEMVIKEVLGFQAKSANVTKVGDQSFWGIGLPSITGKPTDADQKSTGAKGAQHSWYSHTIEDTLDKVNLEVLKATFDVNSNMILKLCSSPVLPFEFMTMANSFKKGLQDLERDSRSVMDLSRLIIQSEELEKKARALIKNIDKNLLILEKKKTGKNLEIQLNQINTCLMQLSRILNPSLYSVAGKYGQDFFGSMFKPIPSLQPLVELNDMDPHTDEYRALVTSLVRERNKLSDALKAANTLLGITLERI